MRLGVTVTLSAALALLSQAAGESAPQAEATVMTLRLELFVRDVEKSANFYTRVLGFQQLAGDRDYLPVRNGQVVIGLGPIAGLPSHHHFSPEIRQQRLGLGTEIVLEVDDVDACYRQVQASGYEGKITPPRQRPWGLTDFRVVDPDGYYVRITSR